jgi:hypothetical protein
VDLCVLFVGFAPWWCFITAVISLPDITLFERMQHTRERPLPSRYKTVGKLRFSDAGGRDGAGISCSEKSVGCCAENFCDKSTLGCDPYWFRVSLF